MLSQKSPVRRYAMLALIVFAAGAGIGAAVVALVGSSAHKAEPSHPVALARPGLALAPASPRRAKASDSLVARSARASFNQLAAGLGGSVGLALAPLGGGATIAFGDAQVARAWSTSKVPVLVTLLADLRRRGQTLSAQDRANAAAALEQSDNAAIEALFGRLEQIHGGLVAASAAVEHVLRKAGDAATIINTAPNSEGFTTYGQTDWSLRGEITFYRALSQGCLLSPQDTSYVLGLMRRVIPDQRWGAGSAGYSSGVSLAFKGGWGPQNGRYQVRQTAIISSGRRGYALSILALPASGTFADGTTMLTALATWARTHVNLRAAASGQACSR